MTHNKTLRHQDVPELLKRGNLGLFRLLVAVNNAGAEGIATYELLHQLIYRLKIISKHLSRCTLRINRYVHYSGFYPLWLCELDEEFYEWYKNVDWESVKFAELIALGHTGIER